MRGEGGGGWGWGRASRAHERGDNVRARGAPVRPAIPVACLVRMSLIPSLSVVAQRGGARLSARRAFSRALALPVLLAACAPAAGRGAPAPRVAPAVAAVRHLVDSMVADAKFRSAQFGILVVDPASGDTIVAHNAGKLFMPASNQKLVTGAVALQLLGPDFRFSTTVAATGPIVDGELRGDLVVSGTGDPSVSDHMAGDAMVPLRAMADSLAARGVRRITGAVVPGADAFPDATLGFGWSYDDLDYPYSAGVDELFFNEGFSRVVVTGGAAEGDPVTVRTLPARTVPTVRAWARTVARPSPPPSGRQARTVRVRQDSADAATVIVEGTIAAGDSVVLAITHRDPARAYLLALLEALRDRGIAVDDGVSPWRAASPYPLFSVMSPTLAQVLPAFEKPSQNQVGEILLRTLGRARGGAGSADSGARVVRDQLLAWGAAPDGFVVRDGSGLSRHDVITPETVVRVLDAMRQSPAFALFREALPIAGVDGTLAGRMKGTPAERNVHAKTGTLDMVRSLSGYVTTADGRLLLFSILCNNWTVPVREVERVQDTLAVHLAGMRLGGR